MKRLFPRLALICFLLVASSGCVESPASWLPDSAGFLFVHTDEKGAQTVHRYDLARKEQRKVLAVEGTIVSDLAVHPRGDTFALVTRGPKNEHFLSIFDLTGHRVHRSGALDLRQAHWVSLHWSPEGEQIWLGTDRHHGWYDWRKSAPLTLRSGGAGWPMLLGSPLRPDGAGCVVHRLYDGYLFVDKEGWERRLPADLDLASPDRSAHRLTRMSWDRNQLQVQMLGSWVYTLDTEKGTGNRKDPDAALVEKLDLNRVKGPTPIDAVLLYGDQTGLVVLQHGEKKPTFQVRVHRIAENKSKEVLTGCKTATVIPAPDRKHALVWHEKADGKASLLLVDAQGEVVEDISLGAVPAPKSAFRTGRTIRAQDEEKGKKSETEPATYELALDSIAVRSTKADNRAWDVFNGYPDVEVQIRNLRAGTSFATPTVDDTLEHTFNLLAGKVRPGDTLEIDVWDKDVCYDDHVGLKRLELTKELLEQESIELTFGQVSSLRLRFFALRSATTLRTKVGNEEAPPEDDRIATLFEQLAPSTVGMEQAKRSTGKDRAIVLIHGLRAQFWDAEKVVRPYFDTWQQPRGPIVPALVELGDVYGFSYGQNRPLDEVSAHPDLLAGVQRLKKMGYREIVLVGHSAGGVIARQFAEDHPDCGITQLIQVSSPNCGAFLAHGAFALVQKQAPFLKSLVPQVRMVSSARRAARLPVRISFCCVVGTYGRLGDGALGCASQWPRDLQDQGVPAFTLAINHHTGMESAVLTRKLVDLISSPPQRWSEEQVQEVRRTLFD